MQSECELNDNTWLYILSLFIFSYVVNCNDIIYADPDNNEVLNVALRRKCLPTPGIYSPTSCRL